MPRAESRRRIHLTAVASPATESLARLEIRNVGQLVRRAQSAIGDRYRVTANGGLIFAREDDAHGGRTDDAERACEITRLLADDHVAAVVTIRGGAWFARLLDSIDWDVLKRRGRTIHLFGFSEMTPLIAIAGRYPRAVGVYDLGPGFLAGGMRRYAKNNAERLAAPHKLTVEQQEGFGLGWAAAEFPRGFDGFLREVADILSGNPSPRVPAGRLLQGSLPQRNSIIITGGNLSLVQAMVGSKHASAIDPKGKWLALEDLNEPADTLDRMLAGLKLAGLFDRAEGIILGDFHNRDVELGEAVFHSLKHHLPRGRRLPVVRIHNFGHIYPIAPLPLHRRVVLRRQDRTKVTIEIPWEKWV